MVVIRLSLRSRPKNHKHYQMLVSDQRRSTKGKFIERVGCFDPSTGITELKLDRINHWVSQGAQMSPRVKQILKQHHKNKDN